MPAKNQVNAPSFVSYVIAAAIVVAMVALLWAFLPANVEIEPTRKAQPYDNNAALALWAMQDHVKAQLKAPATAEFPGGMFQDKTGHVTAESGGTYRVSSYVDSENSFGAKLRTNYSGRIRLEPSGRWTLLELQMQE